MQNSLSHLAYLTLEYAIVTLELSRPPSSPKNS
jgi:hypothetical protein